jgi:hypothetical protein
LSLLLLAALGPAQAAQFVYEGRLDDRGQPANGRYDLKLTAFGQAAGGTNLAAPVTVTDVAVKDGQFRVELDLPLVAADQVWLEVALRGSGEPGFSAIPGRSKAIAAPLIGACWSTTGDSGSDPSTNFIGTTDAQPFVVRTRNAQSLRIEPSTVIFSGQPITTNTIAGSSANSVTAGVRGATIAGGGVPGGGDSDPDFGGENPNRVTDHYGTVGGGYGNQAGDAAGTPADRPFATVGGGRANAASAAWSSVGGGDSNTASGIWSTVGGGSLNAASAAWSSVGGGDSNTASGDRSTVGGGFRNTASGNGSTVGGGENNTASGVASTVSGGTLNCAGSATSWAGGRRAKVKPGSDPGGSGPCSGLAPYPGGNGDQGTFVWADSQDANFVSTGPNQFLVRADGGLLFNTNTLVSSAFDDVVFRARNSGDVDIDLRLVTRNNKSVSMYVRDINGTLFINPANLESGADRLRVGGGTLGDASLTNGGAWTNASSRSFKEGFAAVDTLDVLNRLLTLPITTWQYIGSNEGLHLGPVAEDFKAAFGLAGDGKTIATVDADGVALAAIQGLNAKLEAENAALRAAQERLAAELAELRAKLLGTTEER